MKKVIGLMIFIALIMVIVILYFIFTGNSESKSNQNENAEVNNNQTDNQENTDNNVGEEEAMSLRVSDGTYTIIFELNNSTAARSLYDQLPLDMEVQNYSSNEKIFYPPNELEVDDAPRASGGLGVLAYYAPWGDVVMFYDSFRENSSLYELGYATEGIEEIENLNGKITIEKIEN